MPGLTGFINFKGPLGKDKAKAEVKQMATVLSQSHDALCSTDLLCCDHGAMAVVVPDNYRYRGLVVEDDETCLGFWGYLWDDESLRRRAGMQYHALQEISVSELLLAIYRREGIAGLQSLNGRFVIALWLKEAKTLRLITDRFGFANLYYCCTAGKVFFASEYKAFVWHRDVPRTVDEEGIADLMTLGYCAADRTLFSAVKLVSPGSVFTFSEGQSLLRERYWDYSFYSEGDPLFTEEDYVDQFYTKLKTAILRQCDAAPVLAIPLSGGYDSRSLAGMIEKLNLGGRVETLSYGNLSALDVVYGRKIAKNLGFRHAYLPIESSYLSDHAERFVWLLEGGINCLNAHMLETYPFLKSHRLASVATGFFGDIICGSAAWIYSVGVPGGTDDEEIFRRQYAVHANIMNDGDLEKYALAGFRKRVQGTTYATLRARYYDCPSQSRYYRSRYFSTHERQRRYTSFNLHIFDQVAEVLAPFVDSDFVDFAYHLPPSLAIYQNIYRKMIVKHLPKVASVPHNETRLPLNASRLRLGLQWRWERLLNKPIARKTVGRNYARLNDNYLNSGQAICAGSRELAESRIRNNPFLAEYFNMTAIHQLLDAHLAGRCNEYGKLTALLTLSLWHQLFVESKGFGQVH